MNTYSVCAI